MEDRLVPWLILKNVTGIGSIAIKRLLEVFGNPQNILTADFNKLIRVEGVGDILARQLTKKHALTVGIKKEIDLINAASVKVITLTDAAYPSLLKEICDPPTLLYVKGSLDALKFPIAIVGARKASNYGLATTRKLAADLARKGFTIVSGMALGIDSAAHQGALEVGGATVAVLGSGLNQIYPPKNRKLAEEIALNGAVISEYPMNAEPLAFNFPKRNRIISGMSLGVVVTEAGNKSGSLITAKQALDQNREVFAVPGSIQTEHSTGCHYLLKSGAKLVETDSDIIEELGGTISAFLNEGEATPPVPKDIADIMQSSVYPVAALQKLYSSIEADPKHIDALCREFNRPASEMLGMLIELELEDLVQKLPGDYYIREDIL